MERTDPPTSAQSQSLPCSSCIDRAATTATVVTLSGGTAPTAVTCETTVASLTTALPPTQTACKHPQHTESSDSPTNEDGAAYGINASVSRATNRQDCKRRRIKGASLWNDSTLVTTVTTSSPPISPTQWSDCSPDFIKASVSVLLEVARASSSSVTTNARIVDAAIPDDLEQELVQLKKSELDTILPVEPNGLTTIPGHGIIDTKCASSMQICPIVTLLTIACRWGHFGLVKKLLSIGAKLEFNGARNRPLDYAIEYGHCRVVQLLRIYGQTFRTSGLHQSLITICIRAARHDPARSLQMLQMLLDRQPHKSYGGKTIDNPYNISLEEINKGDENGWTALHWTTHVEVGINIGLEGIRLLLAAGADPTKLDNSGNNALNYGVKVYWSQSAESSTRRRQLVAVCRELAASPMFIEKLTDPRQQHALNTLFNDITSNTRALTQQSAAHDELGQILDEILYNACDYSGRGSAIFFNALQEAISQEQLLDMMSPGRPLARHSNSAAVHAAAQRKMTLQQLEKFFPDGYWWDQPNRDGVTPLLKACSANAKAAVKFLLEKGVDANHNANDGSTPLIAAVGDIETGAEIARLLKDSMNAATARQADGDGYTALHWAAHPANMLPDTVEAVLDILRPTQKLTWTAAQHFLLAPDKISHSTVLHQVCQRLCGDVPAKKVKHQVKIIGLLIEEAKRSDRKGRVLQLLLLMRNASGNTALHLLVAYAAKQINTGAFTHHASGVELLLNAARDADKLGSPTLAALIFSRNKDELLPEQMLRGDSAKIQDAIRRMHEIFKRFHPNSRSMGRGTDAAAADANAVISNSGFGGRRPAGRRHAASPKAADFPNLNCIRIGKSLEGVKWVDGGLGSIGCLWISENAEECALQVHKPDPVPYTADGLLSPRFIEEHLSLGVLNYTPSFIVECSSGCSCDAGRCQLRVISRELIAHPKNESGPEIQSRTGLEARRSASGEYGLYTAVPVPQGAFIATYTGELFHSTKELHTGNEYVLGITLDWECAEGKEACGATLSIDAKKHGNLTRFINHSCSPNLVAVEVYSDDWAIELDPEIVDISDWHGKKIHRVPLTCFFAAEDISAGAELTWNYNYASGQIPGRVIFCTCGKQGCQHELLA